MSSGTHRIVVGTWIALLVAGGLFSPGPSGAEVKLRVGDDGITKIYNEGAAHRARRTAAHLVAVPDGELERLIDHHSSRQGLDSRLVRAVVQVESGYNPRALSVRGAMGLMQLMPATARELSVSDPYDLDQNLRGGTTYLRKMLDRFGGRLEFALAAYNAGPSAVDSYSGVPPYEETRAYVAKVYRLVRGEDALIPASPGSEPGRKPYFVRRPNQRPLLTTEKSQQR